MLVKSFEKRQEQAIWEGWLSLYPWMEMGYLKFQSFDEFKKSKIHNHARYTLKTNDEIVEELVKVVAAYEGR